MASEVIKLNIIPTGEMPVFHCSQFDNGRLINIELYRGEDAYTIPEGFTAELHCRKVDGNIVTIGSPVIDENTIKFTSTTQLTACNGKNLCEIAILGADDYLIGSLNFWLEVEIDPLKGGINSTSEIHDLYEQVEEITTEVIGDNYYNKTQVDDLLDAKADKSNTYTKAETNTLLAAKADADNVYTKGQVETKLAAKADAADVYTKDETDTLLDAKANANGVYSKVEVDAMVDDLEDAIDLKADQSTTYTKTEVDTALSLKANAADVYTKAETDAKIEEAIEDILPVDTAGPSAIASFTTGLALPLVACEVDIEATGGNGTPDNPNPINGYTEANITANGDTVTISFGQTVYGGVLNVTRGKLHVTWVRDELSSLTWTRNQIAGERYGFQSNVNNLKYALSGVPNMLCEVYQTYALSEIYRTSSTATGITTATNASRVIVFDDNYSDADIFKNSLSGKYFAYELATPFDIDLTPEVISAIVGTNNVFADTNGNTTVKFKDTIQNYIDKKVST